MSIKEVYDYYAKEGYLRAIPNGPLTIYDYQMKTEFENNWNFHTLSARGLVLDEKGECIARPFTKFFNLNQRPETRLENLPKETPELAEKYDGSMIIVFFDPYSNKWKAITRGCWDNIQTQFAYKWLEKNQEKLDKNYTFLFELIAPWNRIVCYYPEEKMVLIGVIHTVNRDDWPYYEVQRYAIDHGLEPLTFSYQPIESIDFANPNIINDEGFVARYSNGFRIKIKYDQYKYLHRVMTGLSTIGIWESLSTGSALNLEHIPDEFIDWFNEEKLKLQTEFKKIKEETIFIFSMRPREGTRKEIAQYFTRPGYKKYSGILFRMLDGQEYEDKIWEMVRPEGKKVFKKDKA